MRIVAHSVDDLDTLAQDFEDTVNQQIRHVLTTSLDHISSDVDSLGYIATRWSNDAVKKQLLPKLEVILRSGALTVHKRISDKVLTAAAPAIATAPKRTLSVPFIPDPIMEHYLSEAENRLVNVGDIVWGKARDAMLEGVQAGEGINDIKDRIVASSDLAAPRAGVIARTEVNSAANFGSIQGMRALDVSAKKEWIATTDARTRQSHVDADAQQVELHEPFMVGDVPLDRPGDPNGPPEETINCLVGSTRVDYRTIRAITRRWYKGDVVTLRFASGNNLTVTPNHPVLRSDGSWISAGLLAKGDYCISSSFGRHLINEPNKQSRPSEVSEVYRSACQAQSTQRVDGRVPDFHGDGSDSEVEIIPIEGPLNFYGEPATFQEIKQLGFTFAGLAASCKRSSNSALMGISSAGIEVNRTSAPSLVGSNSTFPSLPFIEFRESNQISRATVPKGNSSLTQVPSNDRSTDAINERESKNTFSVDVALDRLVWVGWQPFAGHVYNLDTGVGWYTANGTTVRNCRCTVSFELPDEMVQDVPLVDENQTPIAASAKGDGMPWHTVKDNGECPTDKPWAVVQDDTEEVVGCHANEADANAQLAALNASEKSKKPATGGTEGFDAIAPAPVSDIAPAIDGNPSGWEGVIVVEGVPTGDGREFAPDALSWSDLPLPLRWNKEDSHGGMPHTVAVNVGRIDEIWKDGNEIKARGVFNLNEGDGKRAYDMVKDQFLRGVSVDVDDVADADMEMIWSQEDDPDADIFDLLFAMPEKIIFHHGRIRAATLCDIPAFPEAYVKITDPTPASLAASAAHVTVTDIPLVAHAAEPAWNPPVEWFNNPNLPLLCPITVTAGGRVYGHAAEFGDCHIGYGDRCVKVPMEDSHDYFMTGTVVCADGSEVAVGQITADIPHAPTYGIGSDVRSATAHYDQTDAVVADVVVGNDQHGIWVAGAIRPWAKAKGVHALRASGQVSPDWRSIGGSLRMVGLLTVNISGFQVPKPAARVASGRVVSLVAAGIPALGRGLPEATAKEIETKTLVQQLAARIGLDDKSKEDARRQRVNALAEYIHKGGDKANV